MTKPPLESPPRVIVADDHKWMRIALIRVIVQTLPTAEVIATDDGLEALLAYQQGGADFLVTDNNMPRMDGLTLIHQVREIEPDLPILMVSVKPETRTKALAAGASLFLSKEEIPDRLPEWLLQHTRV